MVTEQKPSPIGQGPSAAEILRLRQQLAAREEVIRQLTRQLTERPDSACIDGPEPDQDVLAEALANGIALEAEVQRLRYAADGYQSEIAALRHQLGVYDRLHLSTAVGGAQKFRGMLRRVSGSGT